MKIDKRTESLKQIRNEAKVPGVLYGKKMEPTSIQAGERDLSDAYRKYGETQTFKIKLGRSTHLVYFKAVQKEIVNHSRFLHFDLLKVDKDDIITAKVPLIIIGRDLIENQERILQVISDSVEVAYGAEREVSSIEVDVSKLNVGDSVRVQDLVIPEGIEVVDHPEKLLLQVSETSFVAEEDSDEEDATEEVSASQESTKE
jgi:large subunit ribosomal protein L25